MNYKTYPISDLIDEIAMGPFGSNIKVDCFVDKGIPVLNGSNLEGFELSEKSFRYVTEEKADSLKKANAHKGEVVITHRGTLGQIVYIPQTAQRDRYVISQSQFRVKCNKKVLPEYFVYYFHTPIGQHKLLSNASQVGVPALARPSSTFQKIEIEIPDLETQKKVVKLIGSLQTRIKTNAEINDNLEQQAQALYKHYFPYSVGDELPDGWRIGSVGEIIEIHDSKRIPLSGAERAKMEKKTYPYYGAAALMDYVDDYIFDGKYLLLGEDGTVVDEAGYPILQYVWGQFWVNNHAHILTGKLGFNVESLYMLFKQTPVKAIVTGAVQPKISQTNLRSIQVVIPPPKLLTDYNSQIEPLFALLRTNEETNKSLTALRDTLLPKLMSGELDVSNIQL